MGASRKGEREPGKSDEIDALAVARAVVKDGVEQFPVAYLNEQAMEIRLLLDHRNDLVAERTRTVNRLRWHLLDAVPRARALAQARGAQPGARAGPRRPAAAEAAGRRAGQDRARADLAAPQPEPPDRALQARAGELVKAHRPQLLAEHGCGALTAAILIGHTAGVERFRSDASFALQTGTAPIPCSSGQRTQHRLNRGGDRQLNHALHIIAITRAQRDPATKEYLARKEAEGKTTKGALRCLKRHLARRFYHLLAEPPADQQPATNGQAIIEPLPAATTRAAGDPATAPATASRSTPRSAQRPARWSASARPRRRPNRQRRSPARCRPR